MSLFLDRVCLFIVALLPRRVLYWAVVRMFGEVATLKFPGTHPSDISVDALLLTVREDDDPYELMHRVIGETRSR